MADETIIQFDKDSPDYHRAWIAACWRRVAAWAWEGYQSSGRGVLMVDFKNAKPAIGQPFTWLTAEFWFVPTTQMQSCGGWGFREIEKAVSTYEPAREVVFLFTRTDGGLGMQVIGRPEDLPPCEASRLGYATKRINPHHN